MGRALRAHRLELLTRNAFRAREGAGARREPLYRTAVLSVQGGHYRVVLVSIVPVEWLSFERVLN